jgi:hypothetical protein
VEHPLSKYFSIASPFLLVQYSKPSGPGIEAAEPIYKQTSSKTALISQSAKQIDQILQQSKFLFLG